MTATNHYLTGVAIATIVPNPIIALPLAFISHFILDVLPHFGDKDYRQKLPKFYWIWRIDFVILCGFLIWTFMSLPWWFMLAGFLGTSPDLAWVYRFQFLEKQGKYHEPKMNWFNQFHAHIQKFERSWGIYLEVIYACFVAYFLFTRV